MNLKEVDAYSGRKTNLNSGITRKPVYGDCLARNLCPPTFLRLALRPLVKVLLPSVAFLRSAMTNDVYIVAKSMQGPQELGFHLSSRPFPRRQRFFEQSQQGWRSRHFGQGILEE